AADVLAAAAVVGLTAGAVAGAAVPEGDWHAASSAWTATSPPQSARKRRRVGADRSVDVLEPVERDMEQTSETVGRHCAVADYIDSIATVSRPRPWLVDKRGRS